MFYLNGLNFIYAICAPCFLVLQLSAQHVPFSSDYSVTWAECIEKYRAMDESSDLARLNIFGQSDAGKPLHVFIVNSDGVFHPELFDRRKTVVLINNDIHAGEPDGVDASLVFFNELLDPKNDLHKLLDHLIICVIPMYNVDGASLRSDKFRVNQNGPAECGFRANARNLDLNRDFIKCDSRNAKSFSALFTKMMPHVFIDTHVSNGADYPYTMTLITTQQDKLGGASGKYLREVFEPALFVDMKVKGFEMCPYVNTMGRTPESGIVQFMETPRFATGYAALFNTIGFTTETHMLKPFAERVESTYQFFVSLMNFAAQNKANIIALRAESEREIERSFCFPVAFELDTTVREFIRFSGFKSIVKNAEIGTGERLYYDRNTVWIDSIPYYGSYKACVIADIPEYYIIPQAWAEVIERLKLNGVQMRQFKSDTLIHVKGVHIESFQSASVPYEGHFPHKKITTKTFEDFVLMFAGDYLIPTDQPSKRFLLQVLEPTNEDSYFAWNFFDSILQQKEWFSDYVFEERAAELLESDKHLKHQFEEQLKTDPSLKSDHWNQLYWIYKNSPYYEKTAYRYPVYHFSEKSTE
jgi:hypothetical protein